MITIRAYNPADAVLLTAHFNEIHQTERVTTRELNGRLSAWSLTWVICKAGEPVGYACVAPLPGLPGQYDLDLLIARAWQRQGLGSQLVTFLKEALVGSEVANLSWGVTDIESGIANFLSRNGFALAHEELILACPPLDELPLPPERPHLSLHTYPLHQAIPLFCRLYDGSFAGHAWFQPYTPDEVAGDLISARDILFLVAEKRPFGFAWLHLDENNAGKIEPIGILPSEQGQGNGRFLLLSALHELKQRGAHHITIGTWASNTTSLNLYESLGFSRQQTITYYAYQLQSSIQNRKS